MATIISGPAYVVHDNIDTDQIIPAQYLNLVPTIPSEYEELGRYALCGLPTDQYPTPFVEMEHHKKTRFPIVVAGRNFGCGSSREHAPIAMGAAGVKVVLAQSYARIFFRNCIATGELYPCELKESLADKIQTGDEISVNLDNHCIDTPNGRFHFGGLGEVRHVIDAGGIFEFARRNNLIPKMDHDHKTPKKAGAGGV